MQQTSDDSRPIATANFAKLACTLTASSEFVICFGNLAGEDSPSEEEITTTLTSVSFCRQFNVKTGAKSHIKITQPHTEVNL